MLHTFISDCSPPFNVRVVTDITSDAAAPVAMLSRGECLLYMK